MSDYYTSVGILRDAMAEMLRDNDEQLIYVITSALSGGSVSEAIELGSLDSDLDEGDIDQVIQNLRSIADALEKKEIS